MKGRHGVTAETAHESTSRGSRLLWVGAFTGPAAWSIQLLVNYNLEEFACAPAMREPGIVWGVAVETIVISLTGILALATAAAGIMSFMTWRRNTRSKDTSPGRVSTWMSMVGIMVSILFLIIIVTGFAPPFLLEACEAGS